VSHLAAGGRINPVLGKVGTTLGIKLLLTMRDGRIRPSGVARTYSRAIDRVVALMEAQAPLEEWSVVYSTDRAQAEAVAARLSALCPPGRVPIARLGPALGVHGGPGTIIVVGKRKVC
jgi:fatty acid-binding protein DegV